MSDPIRITEIFYSLEGEARDVGTPTAFVRLTGCPLRCRYCDTAYAFSGGELMSIDQILVEVGRYSTRRVNVTGGEPLAQRGCLDLLSRLCDNGYSVVLETSGAMDIGVVDQRVVRIVDIKTPGSGEVTSNLYGNIGHLGKRDQVKFVICDRTDYEWSKMKVAELRLQQRVGDIFFSASHGHLLATDLADWILEDRLQVRLQIQLHRYLWGDERGV